MNSTATATSKPKKNVILKSSEGQAFELPYEAAIISDLVRDALGHDDEEEEEGEEENDNNLEEKPVVDIMRVEGNCLEKVVEFLKHYNEEKMKEISTPLQGNTFEEVMTQTWYHDFVSEEYMSQELLFDMLTAANYLGIPDLLNLACLKITFHLSGKNAEEIRQILNLPALTQEEEARAREEHRWIFEDNLT